MQDPKVNSCKEKDDEPGTCSERRGEIINKGMDATWQKNNWKWGMGATCVQELATTSLDLDTEMDINVDTAETKEAVAVTRWKAPVAMVLVQLFNTGMTLLSKVVIRDGMFILALLAYRSVFGAAFILPFAHFYERGKWREIDWRASGWIFFNAFIGYAVPLSLYCYGLRDTTPSYAIIFLNIVPFVTFILSLILRSRL